MFTTLLQCDIIYVDTGQWYMVIMLTVLFDNIIIRDYPYTECHILAQSHRPSANVQTKYYTLVLRL